MVMSPALWREAFKPRLAAIISAVKTARPGVCVAYHSCGAIRPIIPELIAVGVDVLNPIQPLCPGMDPVELKREFGGELAFMGGLDTQQFLIEESSDAVFEGSRKLIAQMAAGGGYIFAASHTIQPDTPLDNVLCLKGAASAASGNGENL